MNKIKSLMSGERPDGQIELSGGDGTFGELRYFFNCTWTKVCYPEVSEAEGGLIATHFCSKLGLK